MNMKNKSKIILIVVAAVIIVVGGYIYKSEPIDPKVEETGLYNSPDGSFSFKLPDGWYAKPYPHSSTTIFVNPTEIIFPNSWEGPLTPISVIKGTRENMQKSINALIESEPGLEVTETSINGYKALRIKGVPVNTAYIEGHYYDEIFLE